MTRATTVAAAVAAVALVVLTLVRYGLGANGVAWSIVQVVLVWITWVDLRERRIPNVVVLPLAAGAIIARIAFERDALLEILLAGVVAFVVFLFLAVVVRGGLGMGDVKLAGTEGFLLGSAAFYALVLGVVAGGLAAVLLLAARRITRKSTYAYGPYLALGAAVAVLASSPPALL
jgi:leader peptidase (prepilin peptidase)/N-methyltransferase